MKSPIGTDGYGSDDEQRQFFTNSRRASLSGAIARRRMSNGMELGVPRTKSSQSGDDGRSIRRTMSGESRNSKKSRNSDPLRHVFEEAGSSRDLKSRAPGAAGGIKPDVVARMSVSRNGDADSSFSTDEENYRGYGYLGGRPHRSHNRRGSAASGRSSHSKRSRRSHRSVRKARVVSTSEEDTSDSDGASLPQMFGYESDDGVSLNSGRSMKARRRQSAFGRESVLNNVGLDGSGTILPDVVNLSSEDEGGTNHLIPSPRSRKKRTVNDYEDQEQPPLSSVPNHNMTVPKPSAKSFRKTPMTTSYIVPTEANLRDISRIKVEAPQKMHSSNNKAQEVDGALHLDGWGTMELGDEDSSVASSSSGQSYGQSLYTQKTTFQEIDKYKQKARRRASLENTSLFNLDAQQMKDQLPNFTPAEGCFNASDFVVRCFSARLRTSGFTVLKHNRSRWSKAKHRVLFLLPDGKTLSWRLPEGEEEDDKNTGRKRPTSNVKYPKIDLTTCVEVRHAWSKDPTSRDNKRGTPVLRSRLVNSQLASKSFSLIFKKRTLDFTAFSNDQCKVLMEGFSALCFRLQMSEKSDGEESSHTFTKPLYEDDWVSTVYGGSTTSGGRMSTTNTSHSMPASLQNAPWGF